MLAIEVHRGGRIRAGDEQVPGPLGHAPLAFGHERLDLVEALVDQLGVLGRLLDVSQRDPRSGALNVPDGVGRRPSTDVDIAVGVCEGQVSPLAPNRFWRQPVGQFSNRVDREQRMVGEPVAHGN